MPQEVEPREQPDEPGRPGEVEGGPTALSTRRSFLDRLIGLGFVGLGGGILYPIASYLAPPERGESGARTVVLDPSDPEQVDPETRIFVFGRKPGILVRGTGGEWRAYSAVCTHLSCTVRYKADTRQIWCTCHNGFFDLNGRNLPGTPPPRPLEEFKVSERPDGSLVVSKA